MFTFRRMEVILRFPTGPAMRGEKGKIYGAQVGMQATQLQLINNRSSLPRGLTIHLNFTPQWMSRLAVPEQRIDEVSDNIIINLEDDSSYDSSNKNILGDDGEKLKNKEQENYVEEEGTANKGQGNYVEEEVTANIGQGNYVEEEGMANIDQGNYVEEEAKEFGRLNLEEVNLHLRGGRMEKHLGKTTPVHPTKIRTSISPSLVVLNTTGALAIEASKSVSESIADWASRVQHLAATCSFGTNLEFNIIDKFVIEQVVANSELFSNIDGVKSSRNITKTISPASLQDYQIKEAALRMCLPARRLEDVNWGTPLSSGSENHNALPVHLKDPRNFARLK
uniref:Uncharacterized protein n=1 Tax=Timema bartmani TaxID=61472 RepID=A0A7R9I0R0_9NEOP|nr:unnamed protein product [Timema bartmani]